MMMSVRCFWMVDMHPKYNNENKGTKNSTTTVVVDGKKASSNSSNDIMRTRYVCSSTATATRLTVK
jgi:hypothetical protein